MKVERSGAENGPHAPSAASACPLLDEIHRCTLCAGELPQPPRPVLQFHPQARILLVGQAPGKRAHEAGLPFDDPSGNRLRDWLGLDRQTFYNPQCLALVPMGFCYPGTGANGDLPPLPQCQARWRRPLLAQLQRVQLTLVMGQYAMAWHMPDTAKSSLTDQVRRWWQENQPRTPPTQDQSGGWNGREVVPLPHPSPRNNRWLQREAWFEQDMVPHLRRRVVELLK